MARPKNKTELLEAAQENYQKLLAYTSELPQELVETEFPDGFLNRNVRDVIAHLYHWHTLIQGWIQVGKKDKKPEIPAKGYTWKTTPGLNRFIQHKYSTISLDEAKELLDTTHKQMIEIIQSYTNDELFEKKRYKWTGTTSLAAYLISGTSSHYDWALKLTKKCLKKSK